MKMIHTTTSTQKPYHAPTVREVPVHAAAMLCLSGESEEEEKTERFTVGKNWLSDDCWD